MKDAKLGYILFSIIYLGISSDREKEPEPERETDQLISININ